MVIASPTLFHKIGKKEKKRKEKKRQLDVSPLLLFLFLELLCSSETLLSESFKVHQKQAQKQSLLVMFSHSLSL
jgi:hypothetical protein